MRKVWKLPNLIQCSLLTVITNCLPLDIILDKETSTIYLEYY